MRRNGQGVTETESPYAIFEGPNRGPTMVSGAAPDLAAAEPPSADASLRVLCSCWVHALATAGAVTDPPPIASAPVPTGRVSRISKDEKTRALQVYAAYKTPVCLRSACTWADIQCTSALADPHASFLTRTSRTQELLLVLLLLDPSHERAGFNAQLTASLRSVLGALTEPALMQLLGGKEVCLRAVVQGAHQALSLTHPGSSPRSYCRL